MATGTAAVYVWEDPGDSIMIQLSLDVVDRLKAAVQKGLGAGERGIEIGGILLGRPDPSGGRALLIEGFELVPCEHARGASYTLSRDDFAALGAHLEHRRSNAVVGYFRSHTRPGMYLDQDDFAVISSYFPDASQVCLLVKPAAEGAPVGGFFFWEEDDINRRAPYRQFPLDRKALLEGGFAVAEKTLAPPPAVARPPRPPRTRPSWQVSWLTVPLIAGLFLLAGVYFSESRAKTSANAPSPAAEAQPLSLQIQKTGSALELHWDPNSPAIRKAGLGILRITDGARQVRRELDQTALAEGVTTYIPASRDVNVELQVYALTQQANESVKGWAPPKAAPPIQVAENLPIRAAAPRAPQATAERSLDKPRPQARVTKSTVPKTPVVPARAPVTVARAVPRELAAPPALVESDPAPQPRLVAMLPHTATVPPAPEAEVSYVVPHASVFKRVFHKVSFTESPAQGFVPPSPTHRVTPRGVAGAGEHASVDVKVYIDESGNVSRAQLLTKESEMAEPSLIAARQWHFSPARKHDKPVPSEIVLHFRFGGGAI